MKFYCFNNHHTTIMQGLLQFYKVVNGLHELRQPCRKLTKLQQGCYNLVISVWDMKHFMLEQIDLHVVKPGACWPVAGRCLVS